MARRLSRIARRLEHGLRAALSLLLVGALLGAPACSSEEGAPEPAAPAAATPQEVGGEVAEAPAEAEAAAPDAAAAEEVRVASADLKSLVAPIALYPDPLLELVLQAAAQPGQVVLASRFLEEHERDPSRQADERWDTAVIGLLNHPEVLWMMNEYLDWTTELGEAVGEDLEGVQLAVQELRWSAYNMGALQSNEWQDVLVTGDVVAVLPAQPDELAIPQYDGAALLEASLPASASTFAPAAGGAVATGVAPAAAVPVTFSQPQTSFWSNTALFLGGAALGGLLGYAIGSNDSDDDCCWRWNDPWGYRPWRGSYWRGGRWYGPTTIVRPARPIVVVRPNRPIHRPPHWRPDRPGRPGDWDWTRPEVGNGGSLGRPQRPSRPDRPGTGRPGGERPGGRPELTRPAPRPGGVARPGRPDAERPSTRPARPRPPGVAPARPSGRPSRPDREVAMPRPGGSRPVAARPGERPADRPVTRPADRPGARPAERPSARPERPAARPADRPAARPSARPADRPATRPATREARRPDRGPALAQRESPPRVQRDRERGQQSRQHAQRGRQAQQRPQAQPRRDRPHAQRSREREGPAMSPRSGGGGNRREADRGRQSRQR